MHNLELELVLKKVIVPTRLQKTTAICNPKNKEFVLMLKYCMKYKRKRDAKYCVSTIII